MTPTPTSRPESVTQIVVAARDLEMFDDNPFRKSNQTESLLNTQSFRQTFRSTKNTKTVISVSHTCVYVCVVPGVNLTQSFSPCKDIFVSFDTLIHKA